MLAVQYYIIPVSTCIQSYHGNQVEGQSKTCECAG